MRIGVVGKGGVGKTTLAALLVEALRERGSSVVAIDTDSNPNLGLSLGLSLEEAELLPILPRNVLEGDAPPGAGDVLRDYGTATPAGATLLSALKVAEAGSGCMCGGHRSVRGLLEQTLQDQADVTLVDMEAGLEHLSRSGGTLAHADVLLAVVEPTRKSVLTAVRTRDLAQELGIPQVLAVGNKVRGAADEAFLREACAEVRLPLAAVLPWEEAVAEADRTGSLVGPAPALREAVRELVHRLDELLATSAP